MKMPSAARDADGRIKAGMAAATSRSGSNADVAELRGIQRRVTAAGYGEADVAVRGHGHRARGRQGPGDAIAALVGGDRAAAAHQTHPSVRQDAGAAVNGHVVSAGGVAALPTIITGAIQTEKDP